MDPNKETTSRDDISAAITTLETKGDGDAPPPKADNNLTPTPPASAPAALPSAAPAGDGSATPPVATPPQGAAAAAAAGGAGTPPNQPELKAPVSWKPQMRERWGTMSRELQEEVLRREREIAQGLERGAESRRFMEEFNRVAQPYSQFIATYAQGNPLGAFNDYLKTATLLRMGSPAEKAQAVAMAINEYGVPVELLDEALVSVMQGRRFAPAGQQPGGQPQQFRDPRLDTFLQQQEEDARTAVQEELATFAADPKHEFWDDVKLEVADILEFEASRGRKMTLEKAYEKACRDNESVQATLTARKATQTAQNGAQVVAAARAAATPGAGKAPPARAPMARANEDTVSNDIRAAIDKLSG